MQKETTYNVRVKFEHGNPLSLDLKGCGNLYILPNKEYFFEYAPMQFINYIKQLRRLGITYRLTDDKKGCYMTINMSHYLDTIAQRVMGEVRANLSVNPPIITKEPREEKKSKKEKELEKEIPDLIPKNAFDDGKIKEVKLSDIPIIKEQPKEEVPEITPEVEITEPEITEPEVAEEQKEVEKVDPSTITNKAQLIEYAHSVGLSEVSDLWTKKEIRAAIEKLEIK